MSLARSLRVATSLLVASVPFAGTLAAEPPVPPITVRFTLDRPGHVTLVIDAATGERIRNLRSGEFFAAGDHVVGWDGLDEGRAIPIPRTAGAYDTAPALVSPGSFVVRGFVRDPLTLTYDSTVYPDCGNPPWPTDLERGSGGWLADHAMPHAAAFVPARRAPGGFDQVVLASTVAEASQAIAWVDMKGNKVAGRWRIGGHWTGASHLAFDRGPKAHPEIYLYSAMAWKSEAKQPEIRLMGFTEKDVVPVAFVHPELPAGKTTEDFMVGGLGGLAVHDGLLVYAEKLTGTLHFLDTSKVDGKRRAEEIGAVPLPGASDLCFDEQGRLLVIVGREVHRYTLGAFPTPLAEPERLVRFGLEEPQRITVGPDEKIYVSDWGASHQVKVFAADTGDLLATIGKPGAPKTGPYDRDHMNRPLGVAVTADGHVWVAEKFRVPKRVSCWTTSGELVRACCGPPAYGGGGMIDRREPSRFFYASGDGGIEFALDWQAGRAEPSRIYWLAEETPFLKFRWDGPMHRRRFRDRDYMTDEYGGPTSGHPLLAIFRDTGDRIVPVAVVGNAANWPHLEQTGLLARYPELQDRHPGKRFAFLQGMIVCWTDRNGDGDVATDEIALLPPSAAQPVGRIWSTALDDEFNVVITHGSGVLRLPLAAIDDAGTPRYDLEKIETLLADTTINAGSGGGQAFFDSAGRLTVTGGPIRGYVDGKPTWLYHSRWPSLHAGHAAPGGPDFPGQLLATTRLLGPPVTAGDGATQVWAINSDKGVVYLLTTDGLFVDVLGGYPRDGRRWNMPDATRGMDVTDVNMIGESFFPSIAQLPDGGVWLVAGKTHSSLVRVNGLETLRRLPEQPLEVSVEQILAARDYGAALADLERADERAGPLAVVRRDSPPTLDGDLADWPEAGWVTIATMTEQHGWGRPHRVPKTSAAAAVDDEYLYLAVRSRERGILDNSGTDPQTLFRTGGGIDLRLAARPVETADPRQPAAGDVRLLVALGKDGPVAAVYRPVAPGADSAPVEFTSPLGTVMIDRIDMVGDRVKVARKRVKVPSTIYPEAAYETEQVEIAVPLGLLGWDPRSLPRTTGDIGVLVGRDGETVERCYWHDTSAGIVSDIPSEARLEPARWGVLEVTAQP